MNIEEILNNYRDGKLNINEATKLINRQFVPTLTYEEVENRLVNQLDLSSIMGAMNRFNFQWEWKGGVNKDTVTQNAIDVIKGALKSINNIYNTIPDPDKWQTFYSTGVFKCEAYIPSGEDYVELNLYFTPEEYYESLPLEDLQSIVNEITEKQ